MSEILHYTNLLKDDVFGVIKYNDAVLSVRSSELTDGKAYHNHAFSHHGYRWRVYDGKILFYDDTLEIERKWKIKDHLKKRYGYIFIECENFFELNMGEMHKIRKDESIAYDAIEKFKSEDDVYKLLSDCSDSLIEHKTLITDMVATIVNNMDRWESHFSVDIVNKIYKLCDGPTLQTINKFVLPIDPEFLGEGDYCMDRQIVRKRVKEKWEQ